MAYAPGQVWYHTFVVENAAGVQKDADTFPSAATRKNGIDDGAVTNAYTVQGNGRYSCHGTIPSGYVVGDVVEIVLYFTVDAQTRMEVFPLGPLATPTIIHTPTIVNRTIQSR